MEISLEYTLFLDRARHMIVSQRLKRQAPEGNFEFRSSERNSIVFSSEHISGNRGTVVLEIVTAK